MPFPASVPDRELVHSRTISFKGYRRADGLWDVEGHLLDIRPKDAVWSGGERAANEPIHSMFLRLTVDDTGMIKAATASTDASPYEGVCGRIAPRYADLVGTHVGAGFRRRVLEMVGGLSGCTHMTELLLSMGTVVLQTLFGEVKMHQDRKPFSLDGCHALDTTGEIVAKFHPLWYRPAAGIPEEKDSTFPSHKTGQDQSIAD